MPHTVLKTPAAVMAAILTAVLLVSFAADRCARGASSPSTTGSIAFASDRKADADSTFNIFRMAADGRGPKERLTQTPGANIMPAWSPDGTEIAFVRSGLTGIPQVYRIGAGGSQRVSQSDGLMFEIEPAWFPGGRKIVFSDSDDLYSITLGAEGNPAGAPTRLTTNASVDRQPVVSPSGKKIAFASDRDGDFDVYVMKAAREGSTNPPVKLTRNTVPDTLPDWAPVGGEIAFSRGAEGERDIYTMGTGGDDEAPIVTAAGDDSDPTFSPDGRQIAFASDRTGDGEIWVAGAEGAGPSNLTKSPSSEEIQPDWRPLP